MKEIKAREWIKWWRSKFAWTLIIAGIVALVLAIISATLLPYPYNLIGAILSCIPSGIVIRLTLTQNK